MRRSESHVSLARHTFGSRLRRPYGKLLRMSIHATLESLPLVPPSSVSPKLAEVVKRLAAAYDPLRIYLFGSVARGDAGEDSDYDLLVLVPDDASAQRQRSRLAYQVLRG